MRFYTLKTANEMQEVVAEGAVEETGDLALDEGFRQEVGDALDDLFGD